MASGANLTDEELDRLYELLGAFEASEEFPGEPEDHEAIQGALTLINYARNSRPTISTKEE